MGRDLVPEGTAVIELRIERQNEGGGVTDADLSRLTRRSVPLVGPVKQPDNAVTFWVGHVLPGSAGAVRETVGPPFRARLCR